MKTLEGRLERLERLINGDPKDLSKRDRLELVKREQDAILEKYRMKVILKKETYVTQSKGM